MKITLEKNGNFVVTENRVTVTVTPTDIKRAINELIDEEIVEIGRDITRPMDKLQELIWARNYGVCELEPADSVFGAILRRAAGLE